MPAKLSYLGSGSYNIVYLDRESNTVYKILRSDLKAHEKAYDSPERSIRLWNEINTALEPKAASSWILICGRRKAAWSCPFIEGNQASDAEISDALLDIYTATGRIVLDAVSKRNFIKMLDGRIVLVDVGLALQLESKTASMPPGRRRRYSQVSQDCWKSLEEEIIQYIKDAARAFEYPITTVKALLFIKMQRPDITDVARLKVDRTLVQRLAMQEQAALAELAPPLVIEKGPSFVAELSHETAADILSSSHRVKSASTHLSESPRHSKASAAATGGGEVEGGPPLSGKMALCEPISPDSPQIIRVSRAPTPIMRATPPLGLVSRKPERFRNPARPSEMRAGVPYSGRFFSPARIETSRTTTPVRGMANLAKPEEAEPSACVIQ